MEGKSKDKAGTATNAINASPNELPPKNLLQMTTEPAEVLLQILYSATLCDCLKEFLDQTFSTENLFFWLEVEKFRRKGNRGTAMPAAPTFNDNLPNQDSQRPFADPFGVKLEEQQDNTDDGANNGNLPSRHTSQVNLADSEEDEESFVKRRAQEIYSLYFDDSSLYQVNLSHELKVLVRDRMSNPQRSTFNEAQESIFQLMKIDSLPKFLRSDVYQRFLVRQSSEKDDTKLTPKKAIPIHEDGYRQLIERMKDPICGVPLKDRKWLFKDFPQCFTGTELVQWLLGNVEVENKKEAIRLGQQLLEKGVITHLTNDRKFEYGHIFYKFKNEYEPIKGLNEVVDSMPKTIDRKETNKIRKLLWFVLNHPQYLIQVMTLLDPKNYSNDELAFALSVLIEHSDTSQCLKLVYFLLEHEFFQFQQTNTTSQAQAVLSEEHSIARKVLDSFVERNSKKFIKDVLGEIHWIVLHRELCIDLQVNNGNVQQQFLNVAQRFFELIFSIQTFNQMPRQLSEIVGYIVDLSSKYTPKKTTFLVGHFLMRVFKPALLSPSEYGLIPPDILQAQARRNLGTMVTLYENLLGGGMSMRENQAVTKRFASMPNMQHLNKALNYLITSQRGKRRLVTIGQTRRRFGTDAVAEMKPTLNAQGTALEEKTTSATKERSDVLQFDPDGKYGVLLRFFHGILFSTKDKMSTSLLVECKRSEMGKGSVETFYKYDLHQVYLGLINDLNPIATYRLKLYYNPLDPEGRAVVMFCLKTNIPFEPIKVDIFNGEQYSKELLELNPSGLLPMIDLDGEIFIGCSAILQVLSSKFYCQTKWYPSKEEDPKVHDKIEEFLQWHYQQLGGPAWTLFWREFGSGLATTKRPSSVPVNSAHDFSTFTDEELYNRAIVALNQLNTMIHSSPKLRVLKRTNVADLIALHTVTFLKVLKRQLLNTSEHSGIFRWINALKGRLPNWREVNFEFDCFTQFAIHHEPNEPKIKYTINFERSPHILYTMLLPSKKHAIGEEINTLTSTRKNLFLVPKHRIVQSFTSTSTLQNHLCVVDIEIRNLDAYSTQNAQIVATIYNVPIGKENQEKLNFIVNDWNALWKSLDAISISVDTPNNSVGQSFLL